MAVNFSIESMRALPKLPVVKPSTAQKDFYGPSEYGVLTGTDKQMLEKFSGLRFDFPPKSGQLYPPELFHISQARGEEYRSGGKFSDLNTLLGQVQRSSRLMSGKNAISDELMAFAADRSRNGGGSWKDHYNEINSSRK